MVCCTVIVKVYMALLKFTWLFFKTIVVAATTV
jgi:hypothetical protein